ncbi:MAG: ATPase, T2SS/T4P/T4SS family [Candidatus Paceibacterota bacterium]|jgi:type IV pilus assembly protein PilB
MINLPGDKLRELLLHAGIVSTETFSVIQEEANRKRQNISDLLISQGIINREYLLMLIAQFLGVERVNLGVTKIDEAALNLLPEDVARRRRVIVFGKDPNGQLKVAMDDPSDLETIDFLSLKLAGKIKPYLATEEDLNRGFTAYGKKLTQDFKKIIDESVRESLKLKARGDAAQDADDLPIVAVVDNLLSYAVSSRASDAHFEVLDDLILVRFRIDGILHEIIRMPKEIHPAIIARIKILSSLRVDEHRAPQDGRFRYKLGGTSVDIRVSILPTFYGEKVVMRLLTGAQKPLSLADLGVFETDVHIIEEAIKKTYGMVLACGPTGSGKTTTLYSLLNMLNKPEVNIITVEDPIEYDMRYVNQVQVNNAAGITFASGLRSILRQDPNIVMVGEIRDGETANIAVQAALTGHLVLSSLHTNDAPTTIPRFIDMGVPPFLISAVLNTVVAQRLVRKIHLNCVESYEPDATILSAIHRELLLSGVDPKSIKLPKTFYRGKGCSGCNFLGFVGRIGIYEVLNITETVRKLIMDGSFSMDMLRAQAQKEGMVMMFEDGLRKVERGTTTIEEVMRVIRE